MSSCDGETFRPATLRPAPSTRGFVVRTWMPHRRTAKVTKSRLAAIVATMPFKVGLFRSGRAIVHSMTTPSEAPMATAAGSASRIPRSWVKVAVLVPRRMSK